jgi:glycosylphosphatidylinositol transamidase
VLIAAWKNVKDQFNKHGIALALTLARYFKSMNDSARN